MGLFQVFVCIGDVLVAHFRAKKSSACWSSTCRPSIQFDTSFWREAGGQQFQSDCNWTGGTNEHTEFHTTVWKSVPRDTTATTSGLGFGWAMDFW